MNPAPVVKSPDVQSSCKQSRDPSLASLFDVVVSGKEAAKMACCRKWMLPHASTQYDSSIVTHIVERKMVSQ